MQLPHRLCFSLIQGPRLVTLNSSQASITLLVVSVQLFEILSSRSWMSRFRAASILVFVFQMFCFCFCFMTSSLNRLCRQVTDARATMALYRLYRKEWEKGQRMQLGDKAESKKRKCVLMDGPQWNTNHSSTKTGTPTIERREDLSH